MKSNTLLSLGGLGISATTAVAGPGATLKAADLFTPPSYKSSIFEGVAEDSNNLFSTFDLECINGIFPNLGGDLRGQTEQQVSIDSFSLPTPTDISQSPDVAGCLKLNYKYYSKDNKGLLAATVEMAVSKGNHGIILMNSITNALKEGGYGFDYRALFLKKEGSNWQIKGGIQWRDLEFMENGNEAPEKLIWSGIVDDLPAKETLWKERICSVSEECDKLLSTLESSKKKHSKTFNWTSSTSGKNIYQGLKIKGNLPTGTSESDFWNEKETPLYDNSAITSMAYSTFKGGSWRKISRPKKSETCCGDNVTTFRNWFNLLKDSKGDWKKKNT